jgi:hypothetical protein
MDDELNALDWEIFGCPNATEEDVIYLAGFLDGEGTLSIHKSKKGYRVVVQAVSTTESVMLWLKRTFGGYIDFKPAKAFNSSPLYVWRISQRETLLLLLPRLIPHLKIKKLAAQILHKYCMRFRNGRELPANEGRILRAKYREVFRRLNSRGDGSTEQKEWAARLAEKLDL